MCHSAAAAKTNDTWQMDSGNICDKGPKNDFRLDPHAVEKERSSSGVSDNL